MHSSHGLALFVQVFAILPCVFCDILCAESFCLCQEGTHPDWFTVNCTLPNHATLEIGLGELPENTNELVIYGGRAVLFTEFSLTRLRDPRLVHVYDARAVRFDSFSGANLNAINFVIIIRDCTSLHVEHSAFTGVKGPISVDIENVKDATIGNIAFAWLLKMNITQVTNLVLKEGSFMLDPLAPNVGDHGPGLTITITDSTVMTFPGQSFASSAARVTLKNLAVGTVQTNAFSANTYNAVIITNCSIAYIESEAFGKKSLIYELNINNTRINKLAANALISGVNALKVIDSTFHYLSPGSINGTYAKVIIYNTTFKVMNERSLEFIEWNTLKIDKSKFDQVPPVAIVANPTSSSNDFSFTENEVEVLYADSLKFIGQIKEKFGTSLSLVYKNNYYGHDCTCNFSETLSAALGSGFPDNIIEAESHCIVNSEIGYCFNCFDRNMQLQKFLTAICVDDETIVCEVSEINGTAKEIKNPRFPHKKKETGLSARNAKIIGIIIVTCVGVSLLAVMFTFIKWMRRKGYCYIPKRCTTPNMSCGNGICNRICTCGEEETENAGSISHVSVQDVSELHCLNEPRGDPIQESRLPQMYTEEVVPTETKTTQTLPEELTKELLENLKEKLDDPEKYVEAREMIEHLYELIKVPAPNENREIQIENIYELPFQNTMPRLGRNNKTLVSVGTRTPSIDRLQPLSPYNRNTSLAHEYFEPRDFAIHLYAEIAICDKEKKKLLGLMPDVVGDQILPRGPYLKAMREKEGNTNAYAKLGATTYNSPNKTSSIKSNQTMQNRPLPRKPVAAGPSFANE